MENITSKQERETKNYVQDLLNDCILMLEGHRKNLIGKLNQKQAEKLFNELADEHDTSNYDDLKKYCAFNQYICESFKKLKIEVISAKQLEKYTDSSIFATKDIVYTTVSPLFLSHIDRKLQMIFALLLSYGDISFNTRIQQIDRTIQVSVLMKYLYDTLEFEFDNILKYSQTNQRILKHFIKEGNLPISKSNESKSVINRFSKNSNLLKNYSEMFSLYEWKKSAYDIYKKSILEDDKYFHKIIKSENKLLGFAWGFSVMANGPVEFMSDNANALKSLTLHDNGFNVSSQYIVKDDFSRDDFNNVMVELVACQKRLFDEMNIII